jgi:hypothetical protein
MSYGSATNKPVTPHRNPTSSHKFGPGFDRGGVSSLFMNGCVVILRYPTGGTVVRGMHNLGL